MVLLEERLAAAQRDEKEPEAALADALGKLKTLAPEEDWGPNAALNENMDLTALVAAPRASGSPPTGGCTLAAKDAKIQALKQEETAALLAPVPYARLLGVGRGDSTTHFVNRFDVSAWVGWKPLTLFTAPGQAAVIRAKRAGAEAEKYKLAGELKRNREKAEADYQSVWAALQKNATALAASRQAADKAVDSLTGSGPAASADRPVGGGRGRTGRLRRAGAAGETRAARGRCKRSWRRTQTRSFSPGVGGLPRGAPAVPEAPPPSPWT